MESASRQVITAILDSAKYEPIAKATLSGNDSSGYRVTLSDLEQGMRFGSGTGKTKELALADAVKELLSGAGGKLSQSQIDTGTLRMTGDRDSIDTPIKGFDTARAKRAIAAAGW